MMAIGDILLDSAGKFQLDANGNIRLSDGLDACTTSCPPDITLSGLSSLVACTGVAGMYTFLDPWGTGLHNIDVTVESFTMADSVSLSAYGACMYWGQIGCMRQRIRNHETGCEFLFSVPIMAFFSPAGWTGGYADPSGPWYLFIVANPALSDASNPIGLMFGGAVASWDLSSTISIPNQSLYPFTGTSGVTAWLLVGGCGASFPAGGWWQNRVGTGISLTDMSGTVSVAPATSATVPGICNGDPANGDGSAAPPWACNFWLFPTVWTPGGGFYTPPPWPPSTPPPTASPVCYRRYTCQVFWDGSIPGGVVPDGYYCAADGSLPLTWQLLSCDPGVSSTYEVYVRNGTACTTIGYCSTLTYAAAPTAPATGGSC